MSELRQLRDQIRLKIHLAGMEARQRWDELEPRLEELEGWFERGGERAAAVMGMLVEELGGAFRRFRDRLDRGGLTEEEGPREAEEPDRPEP